LTVTELFIDLLEGAKAIGEPQPFVMASMALEMRAAFLERTAG
jgi:hypothetical protein